MLDVKAIRREPEAVLAALARRGDGSDERLRTAQEQEQAIGRLLGEGLVVGTLVACRAV